MGINTTSEPYNRRFKMPKWNRLVTVTDEPKLFRRLPEFQHFTKSEHEEKARAFVLLAKQARDSWCSSLVVALERFGDGNGVLISGVYRDHFDAATKDALRTYAHDETRYMDYSLAHWRASGRRVETWRAMRADLLGA